MNKELSTLENAILSEIAKFHAETHSFLKEQILNLSVKSREYTGVGIFTNFHAEGQQKHEVGNSKTYLGLNKNIYIDTLELPISFELNFSNDGIFEFLEIISNDDSSWNGEYSSFSIEEE